MVFYPFNIKNAFDIIKAKALNSMCKGLHSMVRLVLIVDWRQINLLSYQTEIVRSREHNRSGHEVHCVTDELLII